jgi:uncharacterized membrane protein
MKDIEDRMSKNEQKMEDRMSKNEQKMEDTRVKLDERFVRCFAGLALVVSIVPAYFTGNFGTLLINEPKAVGVAVSKWAA